MQYIVSEINPNTYFIYISVLPQYECALNCEAVGGGFYARLNETVIDGTPCSNPAKIHGKRASFGALSVCVDGYCQVSNIGNFKLSLHMSEGWIFLICWCRYRYCVLFLLCMYFLLYFNLNLNYTPKTKSPMIIFHVVNVCIYTSP